jgi:streptogramin lyase
MTHNPNCNSSFIFVVGVILTLILAVAFAAKAQVSQRGPSQLNLLPAVAYNSGTVAPPEVTFSVHPVPGNPVSVPGITTGPDGALWFTRWNSIWRMTAAGKMTEYPLPDDGKFYPLSRGAMHITPGPDGALWFTESIASKIGRITTSGQIKEYPLSADRSPGEIAAGPDGALWFAELIGTQGRIGRITVGGTISEYQLSPCSGNCGRYPAGIVAGPDGALWFTDLGDGRVHRITTNGLITDYDRPTTPYGLQPGDIVSGPDATLWFTFGDTSGPHDHLGRITTAGEITAYPLPIYDRPDFNGYKNLGPSSITVGPDGALWFIGSFVNVIGRMTTQGDVTLYSLPTNAGTGQIVRSITFGPDGALWIGNYGSIVRASVRTGKSSTTSTVAPSLNPSLVGQMVTFKTTVTSTAGVPADGGLVTFRNGAAILGTATLRGGTASWMTSSLPVGVFNITASYCGDANFDSSTSPALRQVVKSTTRFATSTALVSSLNPSLYGQSVTWAAQVATSGSVAPTGNVVFRWSRDSQTYTIGTAPLSANGVATLTRSNLNADPFGSPYPLVAVYSGDSFNLGSTSPILLQDVLQTKTAASIASSVNPSKPGQAVTFTAKITSPTVIVTGPVTFSIGYRSLGTAQLSGGTAKFTTTSLPAGASRVKVTYYGNSNVAKSSATVLQTVQ